MKNIYDLEGNYHECTAEATLTGSRTSRGGYYFDAALSNWYPASDRFSYYPTDTFGYFSARPALYVNL